MQYVIEELKNALEHLQRAEDKVEQSDQAFELQALSHCIRNSAEWARLALEQLEQKKEEPCRELWSGPN